MHPEFCAADTTFGTNNEKKELFTLAFLDGNKKAFNGGRAYLPNAQRWVFSMIFRDCLPHFWGKTICNNLRLLLTDGCSNEYLPFIKNCGLHNSFPNAVHGLCYFHLVIQGYKKHVKPLIPTVKPWKKKAKRASNIVMQWLKTWFFDLESEREFEDSTEIFFE